MLEFLNRWAGAVMAGLTIALICNAWVMYGVVQRMDERILTLEAFSKEQRQANETVRELAQIVAVLQDRERRRDDS